MAFIQWDESLSVGVPVIDGEHKSLIDCVNKLHEAIESSMPQTHVCTILDSFVDHVIYHFRREERVMRATGYPDVEDHKAKHQEFETYLLAYRHSFKDKARPPSDRDAINHINQWLVDHFRNVDRLYTTHTSDNPDVVTAAYEYDFA
jgi:hemerythrin-like metal-binding protein